MFKMRLKELVPRNQAMVGENILDRVRSLTLQEVLQGREGKGEAADNAETKTESLGKKKTWKNERRLKSSYAICKR